MRNGTSVPGCPRCDIAARCTAVLAASKYIVASFYLATTLSILSVAAYVSHRATSSSALHILFLLLCQLSQIIVACSSTRFVCLLGCQHPGAVPRHACCPLRDCDG